MAVTCSPRSARSSRFSDHREWSPRFPRLSTPTCELFAACGYVQEAVLTDYVLDREAELMGDAAAPHMFVFPVTIDDLVANDLLGESSSADVLGTFGRDPHGS